MYYSILYPVVGRLQGHFVTTVDAGNKASSASSASVCLCGGMLFAGVCPVNAELLPLRYAIARSSAMSACIGTASPCLKQLPLLLRVVPSREHCLQQNNVLVDVCNIYIYKRVLKRELLSCNVASSP